MLEEENDHTTNDAELFGLLLPECDSLSCLMDAFIEDMPEDMGHSYGYDHGDGYDQEEIQILENLSGENWIPTYPKVDEVECPVLMHYFLEEMVLQKIA